MTIADKEHEGKPLLGRIPRDMRIVIVLMLASSASFGLRYLAGRDMGQGSSPLAIAQSAEANKIRFDSPDAACAAGYQPAANCRGL